MRFLGVSLLLAALLTTCFAKPLPTMDEIQRRWFQGESEASIHAAETHKDATPAWHINRMDEAGSAFTYATDERTMGMRSFKHQKREDPSPSMLAKMKSFVKDFWRKQAGEKVARDYRDMDEAPVLKPRKGWNYQFRA